jgi:hypothetical protein
MGYFDIFVVGACSGLGLLLAGGASLLLLGKGSVVRGTATLAGLAAGVAAAAIVDEPGIVPMTAKVLAGALVAILVLGSRSLVGGAAAAVAAVRRPVVRYALAAAAGIAAIVGSAAYFQWADQKELQEYSDDLALMHTRAPSVASDTAARTDMGTAIVLNEAIPRNGIDFARVEDRVLTSNQLASEVIRRGPCTDLANCHGWVFTRGRYIIAPDDVARIIAENGYEVVCDPQPGDLVVYRSAHAISHTAIVRYVTEGQPILVEGKWGNLGVYLHRVDKSTYGIDYTFYRSNRVGHLLAGLDSAENHDATSAAIPE